MTCNYVDFAFVRLRTKTGLGDLKFRTYKHLMQVNLTRFPLYAGVYEWDSSRPMILYTWKGPNTTPSGLTTLLHPVASFYLVRGRVPLLHSVSNITCSVEDKPVSKWESAKGARPFKVLCPTDCTDSLLIRSSGVIADHFGSNSGLSVRLKSTKSV